jgi:hypothetical protein
MAPPGRSWNEPGCQAHRPLLHGLLAGGGMSRLPDRPREKAPGEGPAKSIREANVWKKSEPRGSLGLPALRPEPGDRCRRGTGPLQHDRPEPRSCCTATFGALTRLGQTRYGKESATPLGRPCKGLKAAGFAVERPRITLCVGRYRSPPGRFLRQAPGFGNPGQAPSSGRHGGGDGLSWSRYRPRPGCACHPPSLGPPPTSTP